MSRELISYLPGMPSRIQPHCFMVESLACENQLLRSAPVSLPESSSVPSRKPQTGEALNEHILNECLPEWMNDYMNGRKGNKRQLNTHIPRAHLTTLLPSLPSSAKSFVPIISGLGSSVPEGRGRASCSVVCRTRHGVKDHGICPAINYLCNLGQAI